MHSYPMFIQLRPLLACAAAIAPLAPSAIAQDTINTDRPGLTFSPYLVPVGRFQAELGLPNVALTQGNGIDSTAWNTPLQLRYGLNSALELRLGSPLYTSVRDDKANTTIDGFGDVEAGAKLALCEAAGVVPKAALVGGIRLPVGEDDFTSHEAGYNINATGDWDLGNGNSLRGTAGLVRTPIGSDDALAGSLVACGSRSFNHHTGGYVEAAYLPGFQHADDQAFVGAGIGYLITDDLQLDLSGDFGLNADSPDAIVGFGISWRR